MEKTWKSDQAESSSQPTHMGVGLGSLSNQQYIPQIRACDPSSLRVLDLAKIEDLSEAAGWGKAQVLNRLQPPAYCPKSNHPVLFVHCRTLFFHAYPNHPCLNISFSNHTRLLSQLVEFSFPRSLVCGGASANSYT